MSEKQNKKRLSLPKFDSVKLNRFIDSLESLVNLPKGELAKLVLGAFVYDIEFATVYHTHDFNASMSIFLERVSKFDFESLSKAIDGVKDEQARTDK